MDGRSRIHHPKYRWLQFHQMRKFFLHFRTSCLKEISQIVLVHDFVRYEGDSVQTFRHLKEYDSNSFNKFNKLFLHALIYAICTRKWLVQVCIIENLPRLVTTSRNFVTLGQRISHETQHVIGLSHSPVPVFFSSTHGKRKKRKRRETRENAWPIACVIVHVRKFQARGERLRQGHAQREALIPIDRVAEERYSKRAVNYELCFVACGQRPRTCYAYSLLTPTPRQNSFCPPKKGAVRSVDVSALGSNYDNVTHIIILPFLNLKEYYNFYMRWLLI